MVPVSCFCLFVVVLCYFVFESLLCPYLFCLRLAVDRWGELIYNISKCWSLTSLSIYLSIHTGKTTLIKLMTGELNPTKGAIKKNMHLKISRFTQHFEEKLDLSMTPLDFFKQKVMPEESIEKIRPLLGRYGCTGSQQSQIMSQLSAGQKARIVFAIIAHEKPHLLLLDEPTNPLDMPSIDALARCLNKFQGGVLIISHDMRLISQCAQEIYICDNKSVTKYNGDIMKFKLHTKKEGQKKLAQHMNG